DDAGSGAGRLEQDDARGFLTLHGVRDRASDPGHPEEPLLGRLDALGDRRGHLLGLAIADADHAVAVAHHDQRSEAEPPAALQYLGHAVNGDDAPQVGGALPATAPAVVATVAPLAAASRAAPRCWCH